MSLTRLIEKKVEKVWGRRDLPDMFGGAYHGREPLGEIWFEHPDGTDVELLVKYLFTREKLSIQVHPDDQAAQSAGYRRGKDEAWVILGAEPNATIGLGLNRQVSHDELRQAALGGSLESLVNWRPAAVGDVLYSPAGTIHALGPGLVLVEIQQNVDLTYRLYDYGRPRELHLDKGVQCSNPGPYSNPATTCVRGGGREILAQGGAFVLERWSQPRQGSLRPAEEHPIWLIPLRGRAMVAGEEISPGGVWLLDRTASFEFDEEVELIVGYPGGAVQDSLID